MASSTNATCPVVHVSSPFIAVIVGGIAAGILEILSRSEDDLRRQIERWISTPPPHGAEAVEVAVREAITERSERGFITVMRSGAYPPFWSSEDRLVWNATSGAALPDRSQLLHNPPRVRDDDGPGGTVHAGDRTLARIHDLGVHVSKAIDHLVWHPDEASTGDAGYRYESRGLLDLVDRIFGEYTALGMRLIRLAPRMVDLSGLGERHLAKANAIPSRPAGEAQDEPLTNLETWDPLVRHPCFCIAVKLPVTLLVDDRGRAHNANGAFCRWPDGSGLYAIHGITISSRIVEYPDTLSTTEIDRERNAEVRRVMIERFGPGRYLRETRARIMDHHEGIGTLYRREMPNEDALVMIEVVNSTPEPDGSWKRYWLRVPPTMTRAREAVCVFRKNGTAVSLNRGQLFH